MKRCPHCGKTKPLSEFHRLKKSPDGLYHYCKPCNIAAVRKSELKSLYDLTVEEYEVIVGRGCAICGKQGTGREIHMDHDHRNGKVRTALCSNCNHLLGFAGDSPERLRAAADYIESWQRQHQSKEFQT